METFKIAGTEDTPSVTLDTGSQIFEISGRSLPEDVAVFYNPVLDWLDKYSANPLTKTVFNFKLTYFNTASSKMILDVMMKLESLHEGGKEVLVKWHYPHDDEDMKEAGAEYADIVDIPFEQVGYNT
jgi:SiaC family regulatory phosphoprotein